MDVSIPEVQVLNYVKATPFFFLLFPQICVGLLSILPVAKVVQIFSRSKNPFSFFFLLFPLVLSIIIIIEIPIHATCSLSLCLPPPLRFSALAINIDTFFFPPSHYDAHRQSTTITYPKAFTEVGKNF